MSTKTYVSSAALHMIKTDENPVVASAMAALLTDNNMVDVILANSTGSLAGKVGAAFAYAESDYALALPSGKTTQLNTPTKTEIATVIANDIAYPLGVIVTEFKYTPYQPYHEVLDYLLTERLFNTQNNTIHKYSNLKFNNGQVIHITDSSVSTDGLSIDLSYVYYEYVEYTTYYKDNYITQSVWEPTHTYTETVPRPSTINTTYEDTCLIAVYAKLNALEDMLPEKYVWIYRVYTNEYPTLNNTTNVLNNDKYFPVVPIRYNNVDLTSSSLNQTNLHITSKRLLRILGASFESIGKQLNDSPDVDDIDHAYIMFGANLQSNKLATLAYLNHYFDYLGSLDTTEYVSADAALPNFINSDGSSINFTEHGLALSISFSAITTSFLIGEIDTGIVGNARKSIHYSIVPGVLIQSTEEGVFPYTTPDRVTSTLTLDLQITPSVFRRVVVEDLVMTNHVYPGHPVITTLKEVKDDPENNNFMIPLEYNLSLWLSYPERTELYSDCFLLILNTIVKVKLKWYQESWFGALIMIAAIVLSVYLGQPWLTQLAAGALSTTAVIVAVMKSVIIGLVTSLVMKWVVKIVGPKLGIIGAIVLAVIALAVSKSKAGLELLSQYTLSYSQLAMACASALLSASNAAIAASIDSIIDRYDAFSNLLEQAYEDMNSNTEVQALNFNTIYDPMAIVKGKEYYAIPESTDDFLTRTLNLYQSNVYGIHDAIPNFVENLLRIDTNTVKSTYTY